ncbi:type IV pili methyl-accepting chemotaxis transducer N-terminal domain-containing protein [Motiliproteus sediminis]|uniref:type IV pili methyl-accepting chemotaxis transducer N-terminal domain-containing protein n=1 Tax=Motiliproteus sediminis TaxID=1468178 RepID=UPI001AEFD708|nr:type IV pili methyl-accepting chemotaxis transducer N-terminal domain-containing protein [Motiliproteus sediminis]
MKTLQFIRSFLVRPLLISAACITALSGIPAAHAADGPTAAEYGVVLNLSGRQRMLTQKMSKEAVLVALEVDQSGNANNLKATAALFNTTLKGLRDGDPAVGLPPTSSSRILRQLDKIDKLWAEFRPAIDRISANGSASQADIAQIAQLNLPLLKEMNKAVGLYEKDASANGLKADPALAATINLSGKQRMLSQKMSKEFLLIAYGHEPEDNKLNLLETYSLFERTLKGLLDGDDTLGLPGTSQPAIREQLGKVQAIWTEFKPMMEQAANPTTASISPSMVAKVAEINLPLLKEMNAAVKMYEQESAK